MSEDRSITIPLTFTEKDIKEILTMYNEISSDDSPTITINDLFDNQDALEYFKKELDPQQIVLEFKEGTREAIANDWLYDLERFFRKENG